MNYGREKTQISNLEDFVRKDEVIPHIASGECVFPISMCEDCAKQFFG